jgi:ElaB/YqjD/DUF883 family membrane-anchored ribosome-binding protein
MSETQDRVAELQSELESLQSTIERHVRVVGEIAETSSDFDPEQVETYLDALSDAFEGADFLDAVEEALAPLEEEAEQAEQAVLDAAQVFVDDYEVEDVELSEFSPDTGEATLLVPSPKVNQIRGGAQVLALPDGREYRFSIEQTLIAEVSDDKSGYLELILSISELE